MKMYIRVISVGVLLILLLGALTACGEHGADITESPEMTHTEDILSLEPTSVPTKNPESTEPSYDPLNDPNVHWGTELDKCGLGYLGGHIWNGWQLDELLLQAEDDQLIAFYIFGAVFYSGAGDQYYPNIDLDCMEIPEELDRDGTLANLVLEYSHAETQETRSDIYYQMLLFFRSVYDEWTTRLASEEVRIRAELYLEIAKERGFDPDAATWEEKRSAEAESTKRIEEDERYWLYRSECEAVELWVDLKRRFLLQFEDFYIEDMRQVMIDRGLIPVYKTLAENPLPDRTEGNFLGTFVGTAAQIKEAKNLVEGYEAYIFALAVKP